MAGERLTPGSLVQSPRSNYTRGPEPALPTPQQVLSAPRTALQNPPPPRPPVEEGHAQQRAGRGPANPPGSRKTRSLAPGRPPGDGGQRPPPFGAETVPFETRSLGGEEAWSPGAGSGFPRGRRRLRPASPPGAVRREAPGSPPAGPPARRPRHPRWAAASSRSHPASRGRSSASRKHPGAAEGAGGRARGGSGI